MFIELTGIYNTKIMINIRNIISIAHGENSEYTSILLANGGMVKAKETYEEIKNILKKVEF